MATNVLSNTKYFVQEDAKQVQFTHSNTPTIYEGHALGENRSHALLLLETTELISLSLILGETILTVQPADQPHLLLAQLEKESEYQTFDNVIGVETNIPNISARRIRSMPQGTRCSLRLVADYRFFARIGQNNVHVTSNFMISLVARVNQIFISTNWLDGKQYGFEISKIYIYTTYNAGIDHYNNARTVWDAYELLNSFSHSMGSNEFCLSQLFSAAFLEDSVLGIAFRATANSQFGGICSFSTSNVYYNTAVVTAVDQYNKLISPNHLTLILAHELGHSFGCNHDPVPSNECSPRSEYGGTFLMSAISHMGLDRNNWRFSPCSLRQMDNIIGLRSPLCFTVPHTSFCGNGIVEDAEQCDSNGVQDYCCNADCTLASHAICRLTSFSDQNSPCCHNCSYSVGNVCRRVPNELANINCQADSYCNGLSPECPSTFYAPDNSSCGDDGRCLNGECKPYCYLIDRNLQDCLCTNDINACKRCCRLNGSCMPSSVYQSLFTGTLPESHTCYKGVCQNGNCVQKSRDFVSSFWRFFKGLSQNGIVDFMRRNVVFTIIVLSTLFWIPGGLLVSKFESEYYKNLNTRPRPRTTVRTNAVMSTRAE